MTREPDLERDWLRRRGIVARKRLGQNFLVRAEMADSLLRAMEIPAGAAVLEIGPGAGALTRAILEGGHRVVACEIDPRLVELLEERFAREIADGRLEVRRGSILDLDPGPIALAVGGRVFLAGNLPYAITTPILLWAIAQKRHFCGAAVLVQREYADRATAPPGSRIYGSITVWLSFHAALRRLARIEPRAFRPAPKVDSALLGIRFHESPPHPLREPAWLERVLSASFGQRRKMLRSAIGSRLSGPSEAERLLMECGVDPRRRAETLDLEEFVRLADRIGPLLAD